MTTSNSTWTEPAPVKEHKILCPHCQHILTFHLNESSEVVKKVTPVSAVDFINLQSENESLRFENQRLQIINHYHRGE